MQGKTGKDNWQGGHVNGTVYNKERLSGFEIKDANGVESVYGSSGVVGFMVSLVAGALLLSRQ